MNNSIEKCHYIWQRRVIGVMVLLLSPLSVLFGLIGKDYNPAGWWYSISDTYYANSTMIMSFIISVASFFFITYKGYDWRDRVVNLMSGFGLLGLLMFPCLNNGVYETGARVGLFGLNSVMSSIIHTSCAVIAFIGFFLNEMFMFTQSSGEKTAGKKKRNIIYRVCASFIFLSLILVLLMILGVPMPPNTLWIAEFVSLTPCGIAWLIKGESLKFLND